MIMFWVLVISMIVVALVVLVRPFFSEIKKDDVERSTLNVNITKERIAELEIELEQGTISQNEYEQTREELEQALLFDVEQETKGSNKLNGESYSRFSRIGFIVFVPVFAIGLYAYLGQPNLIEGGKKQTTASAGHGSSSTKSAASLEQMVDKLAAKLKENPDNAEGWFMLARSYMSMQRYKEAVVALEKTNKLVPDNPVIMLRYADALTMLNGGRISGKPFELIKRAIALKPNDPTGLWLLGMGYEEQGDYKKAISYWKLLLALLKDEKPITEVKALIRRAQNKGGLSIVESSEPVSIPSTKKEIASLKVNVSIDKNQLKNVSMDDTVFIFARALNGPPMPLAVVRKQVKDLPLSVSLDDSMAMMPTMKLSSFKKVQVVARISKSGSAKAQSGDLQSEVSIAVAGQKERVILNITHVVP